MNLKRIAGDCGSHVKTVRVTVGEEKRMDQDSRLLVCTILPRMHRVHVTQIQCEDMHSVHLSVTISTKDLLTKKLG